MMTFFSFLVFLLGLCVGSFLNVVVYRINKDKRGLKGIFMGRSFCPKCKKKIAWQDNIPLLSFFLLKGKCRFCHSPISWQYPLVELATGLLTLWIVHHVFIYDILTGIYYLLISYALIAIFVSDLLYTTIPDWVIYPAIAVSLLYAIGHTPSTILVGLGASLFFLFLVLVTRGKGMGFGDVKLVGLMGLVLGWPGIIVALYLAFLTGATAGVILILLRKKQFGEHIPFGPFLTTATLIALFWGEVIWSKISAALL